MRGENDSVVQAARQDNWRRLPYISLTLIPLLLISMLAAWYSLRWVATADHRWVSAFGWIDLVMIGWLLLASLFIASRRSSPQLSRWGNAPALLMASSMLIYAGAMSTVEQWGRSTITIYALGCVFVGVLLLMRPSHAAVLYLASYAGFYQSLGWTQVNATTLLDNRVQACFTAVLGLLLSVMLWRNHASMVLLRRELETQQLALKVSNEELRLRQLELERIAQRDSLTGLANRREFFSRTEMELQRNRRHGGITALIMIDLDFFKQVNDTFGHPCGDRALIVLAEVLRSGVREIDVVSRVGGEEFAILLPETGLEGAIRIAEKLRTEVQQTSILTESMQALRMTASFGVAVSTGGEDSSVAALYAAADKAMYAAKMRGRNRVETCPVAPSRAAAPFGNAPEPVSMP